MLYDIPYTCIRMFTWVALMQWNFVVCFKLKMLSSSNFALPVERTNAQTYVDDAHNNVIRSATHYILPYTHVCWQLYWHSALSSKYNNNAINGNRNCRRQTSTYYIHITHTLGSLDLVFNAQNTLVPNIQKIFYLFIWKQMQKSSGPISYTQSNSILCISTNSEKS